MPSNSFSSKKNAPIRPAVCYPPPPAPPIIPPPLDTATCVFDHAHQTAHKIHWYWDVTASSILPQNAEAGCSGVDVESTLILSGPVPLSGQTSAVTEDSVGTTEIDVTITFDDGQSFVFKWSCNANTLVVTPIP